MRAHSLPTLFAAVEMIRISIYEQSDKYHDRN
jgi:hypothetical protein